MATEPLAIQTTSEPTNKLVAGTQASSAIGGVLAGVITAYGGDAIRELLANLPMIGPKMSDLIVMAVVGIATYYGSVFGGRAAAYNVLDRPNRPITMEPTPKDK